MEDLCSSARNKNIILSGRGGGGVGWSVNAPTSPIAIKSFSVAVGLSTATEKVFSLPRHVVHESTTRCGK